MQKVQSNTSKIKKIVTIALFFFFTLVAFLLLMLNNLVRDTLNDDVSVSLEETSFQLQQFIDLDIANAKNDVLSMAESIATLGIQEHNSLQYLKNLMSTHTFLDLYYVNKEGIGTSANDKIKNFSNSIHFQNPIKNQTSFSNPYVYDESNHVTMDISAPIYQNNTLIGLVLAEYSFEPLIKRITERISDEGYALIADGNGQPVFSTIENYTTLGDLNNSQLHDGVTLESVFENIQNRREGSFSFTIDTIKWTACYKPIESLRWYLVLLMDVGKIAESEARMSNIIRISSAIIFLVLIVSLWYTLRSKIKNIENIEKIAYYDELTGLPNITNFKIHVAKTLKKYPNQTFAMIKNDIVNFKTINEMYGYDVGNDVLNAFAKTAELAEDDSFILARIDSDRFIMFSGGGFLENLDEMTPFYEEYFKKAVPTLGEHHLEFTYGRYTIKPGETDINDMINKTNIAHSLAKRNRGQNSGVLVWDYDDKYKEEILLHTLITNKMRKALENNEFVLYLQTKFNLKNEKLVGAEALVRWVEKDGSMIYPSVFIPLFEKNGFVENIDMYILGKTCEAIKRWLDKGYECVPVSVNFSRLHLKSPNFVNAVIEIVDSYNIPHNLIEIELTESTVIDNESMLQKLLDDFYSAGFLVSIDDFGAGYSSLGLLKSFKIHTIKLDRSFFLDDTSERAELVVKGIIQLAHTLGIKVVAEGIEEKRQIDFLKKVKCETVQGYYYDKPMPESDFENKYFKKP